MLPESLVEVHLGFISALLHTFGEKCQVNVLYKILHMNNNQKKGHHLNSMLESMR